MAIAPHLKLERRGKGNSKIKCDECKKLFRVRHVIQLKGKFLCTTCKNKLLTSRIQNSATQKYVSFTAKTLEQALGKIYEINGYLMGNGSIKAYRSFPSILIGHKVKLVLVK